MQLSDIKLVYRQANKRLLAHTTVYAGNVVVGSYFRNTHSVSKDAGYEWVWERFGHETISFVSKTRAEIIPAVLAQLNKLPITVFDGTKDVSLNA